MFVFKMIYFKVCVRERPTPVQRIVPIKFIKCFHPRESLATFIDLHKNLHIYTYTVNPYRWVIPIYVEVYAVLQDVKEPLS